MALVGPERCVEVSMPRYYVQVDDREIGFEITETAKGLVVKPVDVGEDGPGAAVDLAAVHAHPGTGEGLYSLLVGGRSYQLYVERFNPGYRVAMWRHRFDLKVLSEREWRLEKVAPKQASLGGKMVIAAPMPGLVKLVAVAEGDQVSSGQRLVVLEAMKMENDITSPRDGQISGVHVQAGNVVEGGKPLVTLE